MTKRRVALVGLLPALALVLGLGVLTFLNRDYYLGMCVRQGPAVFVAVDVGPFRATMQPIGDGGSAAR
jgi:predicted metal-dependent hydrolase